MEIVDTNSPRTELSCVCDGFYLSFLLESCRSDSDWFDLEPVIQLRDEAAMTTIRGRKAFISIADVNRLAEFIDQCVSSAGSGVPHPFVPLELGIELEIEGFDADSAGSEETEGTLSIWILRGNVEECGRSYVGARGIVAGRELSRFSRELRCLAANQRRENSGS